MPTRIDDALFTAAKQAGQLHSRSAAQQITHWAYLGRALEVEGSTSTRTIEQVLTGEKSYDDLDPPSQAAVRAVWDERITDRIARLNLADEFTAHGETWSEADADGTVVERTTSST